MAVEVKEFILGFIFAIIGVLIGANLLGPLMTATGAFPTEYQWAGALINILAVLGLVMFAVYAFKIA
ncbi:MAG: hypothetical protein OH338_05075 [Candidatus Parvarchaeota archaeon]|nr:hypothetical protein [Candidatus Parvarchaeum tengchongense]